MIKRFCEVAACGMCAVSAVLLPAANVRAAVVDPPVPVQGKSTAYTPTVMVPKDDAPDYVKAYYQACHQAVVDRIFYLEVQVAATNELRELYKTAKFNRKTVNPHATNHVWTFRNEAQRDAEVEMGKNQELNALREIEFLANPNYRTDQALVNDVKGELKVGMAGIMSGYKITKVISPNEAIGQFQCDVVVHNSLDAVLATRMLPAEREWAKVSSSYVAKYTSPPVLFRGDDNFHKTWDDFARPLPGEVKRVSEIVEIDGVSYPVVEHFFLPNYLKAITIDEYEKLNGMRVQWPTEEPDLTKDGRNIGATQPATQPAAGTVTGAATQPATRRAGAR